MNQRNIRFIREDYVTTVYEYDENSLECSYIFSIIPFWGKLVSAGFTYPVRCPFRLWNVCQHRNG